LPDLQSALHLENCIWKRKDKTKRRKKKVLHNKVLKQKLGNPTAARKRSERESVKASLRESSKTMCLGF